MTVFDQNGPEAMMGCVAWCRVLVRHKHPTLVVPLHSVGDVDRDDEHDDGDDGDGGDDGDAFGNDGDDVGEAVDEVRGQFWYQVIEARGRAWMVLVAMMVMMLAKLDTK